MSITWGFFGGSGHGAESPCRILAYYTFFPGKSYFNRTIESGRQTEDLNVDAGQIIRKKMQLFEVAAEKRNDNLENVVILSYC